MVCARLRQLTSVSSSLCLSPPPCMCMHVLLCLSRARAASRSAICMHAVALGSAAFQSILEQAQILVGIRFGGARLAVLPIRSGRKGPSGSASVEPGT